MRSRLEPPGEGLFEEAVGRLVGAFEEVEEFCLTETTFLYDEPCSPEKTLVLVDLLGYRPVTGALGLRPRLCWQLTLEEILDADEAGLARRFEEEVMVGAWIRGWLILAGAAPPVPPEGVVRN